MTKKRKRKKEIAFRTIWRSCMQTHIPRKQVHTCTTWLDESWTLTYQPHKKGTQAIPQHIAEALIALLVHLTLWAPKDSQTLLVPFPQPAPLSLPNTQTISPHRYTPNFVFVNQSSKAQAMGITAEDKGSNIIHLQGIPRESGKRIRPEAEGGSSRQRRRISGAVQGVLSVQRNPARICHAEYTRAEQIGWNDEPNCDRESLEHASTC